MFLHSPNCCCEQCCYINNNNLSVYISGFSRLTFGEMDHWASSCIAAVDGTYILPKSHAYSGASADHIVYGPTTRQLFNSNIPVGSTLITYPSGVGDNGFSGVVPINSCASYTCSGYFIVSGYITNYRGVPSQPECQLTVDGYYFINTIHSGLVFPKGHRATSFNTCNDSGLLNHQDIDSVLYYNCPLQYDKLQTCINETTKDLFSKWANPVFPHLDFRLVTSNDPSTCQSCFQDDVFTGSFIYSTSIKTPTCTGIISKPGNTLPPPSAVVFQFLP